MFHKHNTQPADITANHMLHADCQAVCFVSEYHSYSIRHMTES